LEPVIPWERECKDGLEPSKHPSRLLRDGVSFTGEVIGRANEFPINAEIMRNIFLMIQGNNLR